MFKFSGVGKTYWESSYFGGVKRILIEYPFYKLNYDLYVEFGAGLKTDTELSVYQKDKLINILFNICLSDSGLAHKFEKDFHEKVMSIMSDEDLYKQHLKKNFWSKKDVLLIPVRRSLLEDFVKYISTGELRALFDEYGEDIYDPSSKVIVEIEVPNMSPEPKPGDSPEEGKKESKKMPKMAISEIENYAKDCLQNFFNKFKDKNSVESFVVKVMDVSKTYRKSHIDNPEIIFAKKLCNMLDITQDPKADVVKNLLQGKIDDEKIAEILSGNSRIHMRREEHQSIKPFKVIILGDYSGSMGYNVTVKGGKINLFDFQKRMLKSLFYLFNDLMGISDLEIYGHSGSESPILYRFHSPEYPHFLETIDQDISLNENYDGPIIEHIHKMVRAKTDKPILLISLSDGQPSGHCYGGEEAIKNMKRVMEKIKRDNFVTVGIGMGYTHQKDLYQYSVTLKSFDNTAGVAQIVNRAVKENLVVED